MATMRAAYAKKGEVFYSTKAKELLLDGSGRVAGVRAIDGEGLRDFMAPVTILAPASAARRMRATPRASVTRCRRARHRSR